MNVFIWNFILCIFFSLILILYLVYGLFIYASSVIMEIVFFSLISMHDIYKMGEKITWLATDLGSVVLNHILLIKGRKLNAQRFYFMPSFPVLRSKSDEHVENCPDSSCAPITIAVESLFLLRYHVSNK